MDPDLDPNSAALAGPTDSLQWVIVDTLRSTACANLTTVATDRAIRLVVHPTLTGALLMPARSFRSVP